MPERVWIGRGLQEVPKRTGPARLGAVLLTLGGCWLASSAARGQTAGTGFLPTIGLSPGSAVNLQSTVAGLLPNAPTVNTGLAWNFGASAEVDVGATKFSGGGGSHAWQLYSQITPNLYLSGDRPRLQVRLNYAPTIQFYGSSANQNRIDQNFNGSTSAILWPEHLFLDARAFTTVQSRFGTQAASSSFFSRVEAVQTSG
ncbi:MAG TPA: hypothetical protein VE650_09445, partial [Acetobacteraceae bacterium]|nr:hypothetical protein [Acetobacteraceae bacterium]